MRETEIPTSATSEQPEPRGSIWAPSVSSRVGGAAPRGARTWPGQPCALTLALGLPGRLPLPSSLLGGAGHTRWETGEACGWEAPCGPHVCGGKSRPPHSCSHCQQEGFPSRRLSGQCFKHG